MEWRFAMWKGEPRYTFFDLPSTILSDFDEHVWRALIYATRLFVPEMPPLFYIASGKDSPLEADFGKNAAGEIVRNDYVLSAEEITRVKMWVNSDELHHLELNPGPVIQVSRTYEGNTAIVYWVRSSSVEYPVNFRLQAVQYHRDALRLVLIDYTDLSPVEYLLTWLQWGWGKGAANPLKFEGVPPEMGPLPLTGVEEVIAGLLAQGWSDQEISEQRVVSPYTVETQRKSLAKKLGIVSNKNTIATSLRQLGYPSV